MPGSPPVGRSETRLLFRSLRRARFSSGVGARPSSRQMVMSALAGVVVAAGAQVSRPRPRPRGGRRAGSVGRDEQRRQGPRVIGVGGGAAQHWCRAEAAELLKLIDITHTIAIIGHRARAAERRHLSHSRMTRTIQRSATRSERLQLPPKVPR